MHFLFKVNVFFLPSNDMTQQTQLKRERRGDHLAALRDKKNAMRSARHSSSLVAYCCPGIKLDSDQDDDDDDAYPNSSHDTSQGVKKLLFLF